MKKILASVFLVLAVIAAVGIFGVQTSNNAEAATDFIAGVNSGNGVQNITVTVGKTYVIDLSEYVEADASDTASTTYHIATTRGDIYDADDLPSYGFPANDAGDTTRLAPAFRSSNASCTVTATTCATRPAMEVSLSGSMLTIKANSAFNPAGGTGAALKWVADSTPTGNDVTDLDTYDTHDSGTAGSTRDDTFDITSVVAPTTGDVPSIDSDNDPPDGFFPTSANYDSSSPYATPSWRGPAYTAGAGSGERNLEPPVEAGDTVTWVLNAVPTGYSVVAHSSNEEVATAEPSGTLPAQVVTVTPLSQGTTTITVDVIPTSLVTGSSLAARTATTDKWRIQRTFTVYHSTVAPIVDIFRDVNENKEFNEGVDQSGGAEDPIIFNIQPSDTGVVGIVKTRSTEGARYTNRSIVWGLSPNNGPETVRNFRISSELKEFGKISLASIRLAPGVTLPLGSTHTIRVRAEDTVPGSDGPPAVAPGNSDEVEVTFRVIQGNRAPVWRAIPTQSILETDSPDPNAPDVGDVLLNLDTYASDPDYSTLTYRIAAVAGQTPEQSLGDPVKFRLEGNNIVLARAVDYEDVDEDGTPDTDAEMEADDYDADAVRWTFTVYASDGVAEASTTVSFSVTDEEDETQPSTGDVFSVAENTPAGTRIGTVELDATGSTTEKITTGFSVSTTVNGDGKFTLNERTGALTVSTAVTEDAPLDFEATNGVTRYLLLVSASGADDAVVTVNVTDVNEKPNLGFGANPKQVSGVDIDEYRAEISESADLRDAVGVGAEQAPDGTTPRADAPFAAATDPDAGDVLSYSLVAAQDTAGNPITNPEVAFSGPFTINASTGAVTVSGGLDKETQETYTLYIKVTDDDATERLSDTAKLTITVADANELPYFVASRGSSVELAEVAEIEVNENTASSTVLATYYGYDPDGNDFEFVLRTSLDSDFFALVPDGNNTDSIRLSPKAGKTLDYEEKATYQVEIEIVDSHGSQSQILQTISLRNLNDNRPRWQQSHTALTTNENVARGTLLATYIAVDDDGDAITYRLGGTNGAQYQIGNDDGMLKTLASLDAETNTTDSVTVTASDGSNNISVDTRISIGDVNDRIGSITVKMANPVLGTNGDPNSALADRKTTVAIAVPEAPADLPATSGSAPVNFVETGAAGWGTTLRIEVLAESPGSTCGNGNQCVVIELEGDDSDDVLNVMAYRNSGKDNLFVAAVMPVQNAGMATPGAAAVYRHTDGSVPRIKVDEEDTLRIKFGNLRDSVTIDNEAPEFSNFLPEHEASIDDEEVQYTFTVTDAISGIPDPEDLPDVDGDDAYMAVAALVNSRQCHNVAAGVAAPSGTSMVANTNLHEGAQIYCPAATTPEVRVIVDDKDLDSVTDGYEVDTEVVLGENAISYVTFIACDAAGNCVAFDPDENDTREALAEITVDTANPDLSQARTGVMWDAADNKYDDSRSFIQAIFTDLSKLNPDTIEADDFVVDGYTIKRVYWYDDPDEGDENWTTRYDSGSGSRAYREISKTVFIELEEELLPDATPDVSVVPNGLEDEAGNEQDDDEVEADDWIAPKFAVQSITSPRETSRDNVLAGEDEKVTLTVTSDERISTTKPLVDVDYVNAPAGCVDRAGIILRAGRDTDGDGRLEPGESRADCAVNAKGASLNSVISKDGTNEWTITVDKPSATGYYNVYIYADDRSSQNNRGSEGVNPDNIATDFFEKDGDVNADDAVFFEGDVQLPKPQVVVSGEDAGDTEPTVEFKRPLFIEVDFTEPFSADCSDGDKLTNELECTAESAEYAQDGFDAVTITRFELNGVDMTDDVKTTDDETFLVALDDVGIGDHELKIQARDVAGNELKDVLEIEFEVEERDPFTRRLNPGWNLVSLPGSPADSAIASVFGSDIEVRTVYTYNPVTPGGWQVAVRETLDDAWQGDLTDITAKSGYWVLSDAIQDLEVSIPRLAGGAVGASTPVQPPVIPMYAGWNLIPVVDVTGDALDTKKSINATTYLNSLDDGLDLARVLGFNTITNEWFTVIDPSDASVTDNLQIGSAYWVFVRESASLVPGGIPR